MFYFKINFLKKNKYEVNICFATFDRLLVLEYKTSQIWKLLSRIVI